MIFNEDEVLVIPEQEEEPSLVQKAMQKTIDEKIPKQLQNSNFRFVKIRKKDSDRVKKTNDQWVKTGIYKGKEPYVTGNDFRNDTEHNPWNWRENNYKYNDKPFVSYLRDSHAYGILCGGIDGLVIVDYDNTTYMRELFTDLQRKFPTLLVVTGSKKIHAYYKCKDLKNEQYRKFWTGDEGMIVELRGGGGQCLAPKSLHPSGNYYKVFKDLPIMELDSVKELEDYFTPHMPVEIHEAQDDFNGFQTEDIRTDIQRVQEAKLYDAGFNMQKAAEICGVYLPPEGQQDNCPTGHTSVHGTCFSWNGYGWWCFHCGEKGYGAGGDCIDLVREVKKITRNDAIELIADKMNVDIEWIEHPEEAGFDDQWESMEQGAIQEHREAQQDQTNNYGITIHHTMQSFKAREDIEPSKFWVYPLLKAGAHRTSFTGDAGVGKTAFLMHMFSCIGNHQNFLCWSTDINRPQMEREDGQEVDVPFKGLYLDFEMSDGEFQEKLPLEPTEYCDAWCLYDSLNNDTYPEALLMDEKYRRIWKEFILDNHYNTVGFDNIFSAFPNRDENSAEAYGPINTFFNQLRGEGVNNIEVYHTGKDGSREARGTSAYKANINTAYQLMDLRDADERTGNIYCRLMIKKHRIYVPRDDVAKYLTKKDIECVEEDNGQGNFIWSIVNDNNPNEVLDTQRKGLLAEIKNSPNRSIERLLADMNANEIEINKRELVSALNWLEAYRYILIYRKDYDTQEYILKVDHEDKFHNRSTRLNERREVTEKGDEMLAS